jgi:predicted TIM-barrel fold metal-dependent hydrolase
VGRIDPEAPDVAAQVRAWRAEPAAAGLRLVLVTDADASHLHDGRCDGLLTAAQREGVPVCTLSPGRAVDVGAIASAYPDLQLVIDHLGLAQPPTMVIGPDPWAALPDLLAVARFPNVAVKVSGVPTLSASPFPFADLWPHLARVIDAFGPDRLMWGSDWTRAAPLLGYDAGLRYFTESDALGDPEKQLVLGGTLRRIFDWPQG